VPTIILILTMASNIFKTNNDQTFCCSVIFFLLQWLRCINLSIVSQTILRREKLNIVAPRLADVKSRAACQPTAPVLHSYQMIKKERRFFISAAGR
jgi:hypothetical protein